jgi:hypothetical protein
MAVNSTIKRKTAAGPYEEIHPKTNTEQVEGLQTALSNVTIDNLNAISDVVITNAATGDALVFNGTNWVNGEGGGGGGDVQTVNSVSPDGNGNVQLTASNVGAAATSHTHTITNVTGLQTALDGKAASSHTHTFASLTSKPTTLSGYGITDAASSSHTHTFASLTSKPTTLSGYGITDAYSSSNPSGFQTAAQVATAVSGLVDSAPATLNTLNELAAALGDDPNFATTISTALGGKMSTSHPANLITSTHLYMANGDGFVWNDTTNVMYVRKDGTDLEVIDSGNIGSQSVSNADTVDGFHASQTAGAANTAVVRNSSGYIMNNWFNSNRGNETSAAASYIYDTGDGYMRKKTLANARTEIVTSSAVTGALGYTPYNSTNPSGYTTYSANQAVNTTSNVTFNNLNINGTTNVFSKNNPAISNTSYSAGNNHMELRTTNASHPSIGFHRSGYSAVTLYHDANQSLRLRDANTGQDALMWHSGNLTNLNQLSNGPGYITGSGRAYPRRWDGGDINFIWSGQGGQPPWLWGGSDGTNMYVYNPSNFSVNYANSAGNADTTDGYHIVYGSTGTSTSTLYFVP